MDCLVEIRTWVQTEAKFNGRTDDEFLAMFLRGNEFNVENTKTALDKYYSSRRDISHWWANRNLLDENIWPLAQLKTTTALIDNVPHRPTIAITKCARWGPDLNNFDDYCKLGSILIETIMRRNNCQQNGLIWIMEGQNYRFWFMIKLLSPSVVRNVINSTHNVIPIKFNKIILIDVPAIAVSLFKFIRLFLPQSIKDIIHFCSSDSLNLGDHVSIEHLPEEYGGQAGPMTLHEDEFLREVIAFNDYLVDDNKYGYQAN